VRSYRAGGINLGSMIARGELISFPIGFAHRPRGFGLQARAVTSVAAYLPPVLLSHWDGAAWFSVLYLLRSWPDEKLIRYISF